MAKSMFRSTIVIGLIAAFLVAAPVRLSYAQGQAGIGSFQDLLELLARATEVQQRHTDQLLQIGDVVGTAVGLTDDGQPAVKVFTRVAGTRGIPAVLDGMPVVAEATGEFFALPTSNRPGSRSRVSPAVTTVDPKGWFRRPTPIGVSTGNELSCSAGTISARVTKSTPTETLVYALSNNHFYALENTAPIGSGVLQPGRYEFYNANTNPNCNFDTANKIGTLADYEPIKFGCTCFFIFCSCDPKKDNYIDAAIALSLNDGSGPMVGNSTPSDGYGTPKSLTVAAVLNQAVQKYGRTTSLTKGKISGINATVNVGYSSGMARFRNQLIIKSSTTAAFLQAGDSGSLVVTDPGLNPVGLLFAGNSSGSQGIANSIGQVLSRFGATIDGQQ